MIATLFGVCTSLGLGTIQINEGLHNMNTDIPKSKATQLAIIWSITAVATCSVLSGVGYGIRRISEICFCIGLSLMFSVLFLGKPTSSAVYCTATRIGKILGMKRSLCHGTHVGISSILLFTETFGSFLTFKRS